MLDNNEIKTSYGKVSNISKKRLKKKKIIKTGVIAISGAAIIIVSGLFIKTKIDNRKINEVPSDQIMTTISITIESGDTLSEIVDRYYTDDCEGVYRFESNFEREIKEQNGIYSDKIEAGKNIKIPVIIDKENPYYVQIQDLKKQIDEISINPWIKYTVQGGDTFLTLANLASGNSTETIQFAQDIANKNNMTMKDILKTGKEIWIMNPTLGELKAQLNSVEQEFLQSLTNSQITK